jgi:carbonic anhydrase
MNIARRNLLRYCGAVIGSGLMAAAIGNTSHAAEPKGEPILLTQPGLDITPDEALSVLMEGNKRFVAQKSSNPNQDIIRLVEVAKSQSPFACVLSCSDSRVTPEIVFDRGLGDLFVVRDAGNIATPGEIGSLEYGAYVLGAKVILVLGHESCGAIQAAIKGGSLPGSLNSIMDAIRPAVKSSEKQSGDRMLNAIKANISLQKERVRNSPLISQLIKEGKLKVFGAYYDLNTGTVSLIN